MAVVPLRVHSLQPGGGRESTAAARGVSPQGGGLTALAPQQHGQGDGREGDQGGRGGGPGAGVAAVVVARQDAPGHELVLVAEVAALRVHRLAHARPYHHQLPRVHVRADELDAEVGREHPDVARLGDHAFLAVEGVRRVEGVLTVGIGAVVAGAGVAVDGLGPSSRAIALTSAESENQEDKRGHQPKRIHGPAPASSAPGCGL